jgi:ribosomal protein S18 acetylase RimI-like enzyme
MDCADRSIEIRRATVADARDVSELITSLLHYRSPDTSIPAPPEFMAHFRPDALAQVIASRNYRYHVAVSLDRLLGVIGVRDNRHLLHLFVAPSHHRRGIARALWEAARSAVLDEVPEVEMTVRSSVYAVEVYRHFGFAVVGPRVDGPVTFVPMKATFRAPDRAP